MRFIFLILKWIERICIQKMKVAKKAKQAESIENTNNPEQGNFIFGRFIVDAIIAEEKGELYRFSGNDKAVLRQLCDEINQTFSDSYKYRYLAEIEKMIPPKGSGPVILKYIHQFESEDCRAALILSIVHDCPKFENLDRIIMDLYHHFRASAYYISPPDSPAPVHVIRYDNAFAQFKSPKILPELVELFKSRRELYYLSVTADMIAKKWAPEELGKIMADHLKNPNVTRADVGLPEEGTYYPSLESIVEQTSFNAIRCLRYYPTEENLKIITSYTNHPYDRLAKFAQEEAERMKTKLQTQSTK